MEVPLKTVTAYSSYPVGIEGTVNSAVRAKVPGNITDVLVDEGEAVKKGQTLFRLETASLAGEAGAAKANVNAAQVEVDKLKPLVEKGIISNVQLQTAEARLAQAKANYNSITANIGYATIKSPVNGYVGAINYRIGSLVR
ncbi:efflux RND transporter periplasmic adaptor subunit [Cyclobacterium sp.]|uniref:efflux RND transporter periplasmic adaptor subunit n=1 Tax=Cyclobacterium sp. TaxID=1966343 RepID=UPI0019C74ED3|nr:efflux RND transporter periplasmic adaptor subunit [Cyclobacterium sp.]MBD3631303.1 efflux RND transporter periplasmic adaptor subunit [Cyclobacterium sp.]